MGRSELLGTGSDEGNPASLAGSAAAWVGTKFGAGAAGTAVGTVAGTVEGTGTGRGPSDGFGAGHIITQQVYNHQSHQSHVRSQGSMGCT